MRFALMTVATLVLLSCSGGQPVPPTPSSFAAPETRMTSFSVLVIEDRNDQSQAWIEGATIEVVSWNGAVSQSATQEFCPWWDVLSWYHFGPVPEGVPVMVRGSAQGYVTTAIAVEPPSVLAVVRLPRIQ